MNQQVGKYLMFFGVIALIIGLLIYLFHSHLKWIGRLPGDIRIEKENFRFYFPVVTMILFSILITLVINIFKRFL
jgi:uncharacterized membrane-anchored protein YitT (DUF2179 family)